MWQSQIHRGNLLLRSISIIHELLENGDNKNKSLKPKIYYLALATILQCKCPLSTCNMLIY